MKLFLLALLLAAQTRLSGHYQGCPYSAVQVDPRLQQVDLVTSGRTSAGWSQNYLALEQLPKDCRVALNGTFFSLKWHEPAGPLIYAQGQKRWTPRFKRLYADGEKPVAALSRAYLAVYADGRARIDHSRGRSADQLAEKGLTCLLGGGGQLLQDGKPALMLDQEGFDERSGLRPEQPVARTGVGLDARGRLWLVTAGLEGGGLSLPDFAGLLARLGARQAMFLDCGGSTAMRVGSWQRGAGRPLPTWLVVR
ncbi:MAG: phosphodiester glycosidase family protein [Candidatus Eremiobacteraeota bacterium]|nr:phosphodiester glycosidase family protein [Candidatus Eremiobacteraeota bacterium]MCW5869691.1 phosphodiester glycosidase family protein [Candidatus Eremiobacteraeota bacterium]